MRRVVNRIGCLFTIVILLLVFPITVWGTELSGVSENGGVVTIRNIDKLGWRVGGEYGILENLALTADLGKENYSRLGVRVPVTPGFSFLGGLRSSNVFWGVDLSTELSDQIVGELRVDLYTVDHSLRADYEIGAKMDVWEQLALQLGLIGEQNENGPTYNFMVGLAYSF